jgi:ABC-2 type transport system ATP-binding protein
VRTVLHARGLGKRYRRRWALSDCTLDIPGGRIVGLVGPNGAGKTTLLSLAAGLLRPSAGSIEVCGGRPGSGRGQLARVGFVAQDTPAYAGLTVADHLTLGARLSPGWDSRFAAGRIRRLGMSPGQRAGSLSGGQRAQLALTLAIAKRPELLILDEPVASLDPLARDAFLRDLHDTVADQELSVVHSSHLISDLERVCDYLVVLVASRVQVAGDVSELLARHRLLTAPRIDAAALPAGLQAISVRRGGPHETAVVRCDAPAAPGDALGVPGTSAAAPGAALSPVSLEDLALAYMSQSAPALEVTR